VIGLPWHLMTFYFLPLETLAKQVFSLDGFICCIGAEPLEFRVHSQQSIWKSFA
jgi:hypothetical protein